ncbi:hypothetical protein TELCIR_06872 [Teladorsagia circumcincta]|uniref:Secreted protein n=1 Tax=Teladorsagia circumcincta TaxID=45464 RepID=A0A2G9UM58_TELCI|nr:hypothetical protein TELCIR_06872 [Teladorsagia circumcincta]
MIGYLALLAVLVIQVRSGAVGECRSECVELNLYKIVRVHLKVTSRTIPFLLSLQDSQSERVCHESDSHKKLKSI